MTDIDHYENAVNDLFRAAATSKKLDRSALVEAILAVVVELRRLSESAGTGRLDALERRIARIESLHADPEWCVALTPEEERDFHRDGQNAAGKAEKAPQSDEQGDGVAGDSHEARPGEGDSAGEPLTEEPPVGTQVMDRSGHLWKNMPGGWTRWIWNDWAPSASADALHAWSSVQRIGAPLRLATDADRERVGLPREQWPDGGSQRALDELRDKLTQSALRTLGPDEIAVKVPKRIQKRIQSGYDDPFGGLDYLREYAAEARGNGWGIAADALEAIADALEAKEEGE